MPSCSIQDKGGTMDRISTEEAWKNPEETQRNSRLDMNMGVLKERKTAHASLGDLYQVEIFTDKMFQKEQQLKTQQTEAFNQMKNDVFLVTLSPADEEPLQELLFTKKTDALKKADYASLKKADSSYYGMGAAVICGLLVLCLINYNRYRKRRRKAYARDVDLENIERQVY